MTGQAKLMSHDGRVDWVDYAKGFCICFVVMMHSTLGVGTIAEHDGWLHPVVEFARPFRMPDFFLISGLFLSLVIDRDWRTYLDRKVVHFLYFYLLWMTIQFGFKAPGLVHELGVNGVVKLYLLSLIDPFGTLWFIYLLPIFFVFVKATQRVPVIVIWLFGAALEISHLNTGWTVPDEFAARFIYFYTGYVLAPHIFRLAKRVQNNPWNGVLMLALWAPGNGFMVYLGYAQLPGVSLALGLIGAAAVVRLSALLSLTSVAAPLRYLGKHSIVVYLAFFLPMALTRTALMKTGIIQDVGAISAIVTIVGIIVPVLMFWAVRHTPLKFLFERPAMFWLSAPKRRHPAMQPAE
ncbi:MAG: acyltransferase family protein [Pseudolabrys sp.]|nr:acyltransferase family protein [Pseudolabrys sp.]